MPALFELADVGAGYKRLVASAGQHHNADVGAVAQGDQGLAEPVPHLQRHRIALVRMVEGDDADAISRMGRQDLAFGKGNGVPGGDRHGVSSTLAAGSRLRDATRSVATKSGRHFL